MQYRNIVNSMVSKVLFGLMLGAAMLPVHAKMYKWVDAQGNVYYTDTLPPNAGTLGNTELSKSGREAARSESLQDKNKRLAREAEANSLKKEQDEQARKDRALMATYTSEREIDRARESALDHHRLIIASSKARMELVLKNSDALGRKAKADKAAGKRVSPNTQNQIKSMTDEVEQLNQTIKTNEQALVDVNARYDADKKRFRELKGVQ